jgi:hypothetical protein
MGMLKQIIFLLILGPLARLSGQSVQIVSPADETVVYSGTDVKVTVNASPTGGFKFMLLRVQGPLSSQQVLVAPPYEFTLHIPPGIPSGSYAFTALGVTVGAEPVYSSSHSINVERPDIPLWLKAEPSTLGFSDVGRKEYLSIYGCFADGSRVDLTYSNLTTYTSDKLAVVVVDHEGVVTAKGAGTTRIVIKNAGKTIFVPVEVPDVKPPTGREE